MAESRQDTFEVKSDNGESTIYVIRGLHDDEIETWAAFCASVFSYKENPPSASYFERHYRNDPSRVASLIRVAFYQGQMVASCRLFLRDVSTGSVGSSPFLSAGGIGEVCTAEDHRRRGLSKVLLQNVVEIMKERQLQVSLLHAAPTFFPVYEKAAGYECSVSRWSAVPITTCKLQAAAKEFAETIATTTSPILIREAIFPSDTLHLSRLHQTYSERRFAGCIIRSTDYWNEFLSMELKGSLWVLVVGGALVSWLSLRPRGDEYQLREFGFDRDCSVQGVSTSTAMSLLLAHAMKEIQISSGSTTRDECLLVLPTFLLAECRSQGGDEQSLPFVNWSKLTKSEDLGWMYKILDEKISIQSVNGSQTPHLIWPADSF